MQLKSLVLLCALVILAVDARGDRVARFSSGWPCSSSLLGFHQCGLGRGVSQTASSYARKPGPGWRGGRRITQWNARFPFGDSFRPPMARFNGFQKRVDDAE
ncbi:unnamed protein product, partial [Mesorhabditis spiculigera]